MQYTIRAVPPKLDAALRQQARSSGRSLNDTLLDALAKGTGLHGGVAFNDLDWFIGRKTLSKSFDSALAWLDDAPKDIR